MFVLLYLVYLINKITIKIMKTLYQRLSEENKQKIKEASTKWPNTMELLKMSLKFNYAFTKMTVEDMLALLDVVYPMKPYDVSKFINLFDNE